LISEFKIYSSAFLRGAMFLVLSTFVALQVSGCHHFDSAPPEPDLKEIDHVHTVSRQGETLSLISSWYTGSIENWPKIAEANPKLQVNKMRLGDQIVIPAQLVVQRDEMPAKYQPGASNSGSTKRTVKKGSKSESRSAAKNTGTDDIVVVPPPSSSKSSSSSASVGPSSEASWTASSSSSSASSEAAEKSSRSSVGLDAPGDQMVFPASTPVPSDPSNRSSSPARPIDDAFDFLEPQDGPAVKAPSKTGLSGAGAGNVAEVRPDQSNPAPAAGNAAQVGVESSPAAASSAKSEGVKTRDELLEELLN